VPLELIGQLGVPVNVHARTIGRGFVA